MTLAYVDSDLEGQLIVSLLTDQIIDGSRRVVDFREIEQEARAEAAPVSVETNEESSCRRGEGRSLSFSYKVIQLSQALLAKPSIRTPRATSPSKSGPALGAVSARRETARVEGLGWFGHPSEFGPGFIRARWTSTTDHQLAVPGSFSGRLHQLRKPGPVRPCSVRWAMSWFTACGVTVERFSSPIALSLQLPAFERSAAAAY